MPRNVGRRARSLLALVLCFGGSGAVASEPRQPPFRPASYQDTQGQAIGGLLAPYVEESLRRNGLDPGCLVAALFPDGPVDVVDESVIISSAAHITGQWTYFTSTSVRIYEVRPIPAPDTDTRLVLYAQAPPVALVTPERTAEWSLALVDAQCQLRAARPFETTIPHDVDAMWDVITTDLRLTSSAPGEPSVGVATIDYGHSGGGGPEDQVFEAHFRIPVAGNAIELTAVRQTGDDFSP